MYILARLNLNGQASRSPTNTRTSRSAPTPRRSRPRFEKKKAAGKSVKVAMTFPGGTHDLWIRYWLAAGGIDPDKDIETIVVPPPQMVANMKVGTMDAFCVGEPWNVQLIHQDIGYTALTTGEIWNKHPEKALGMRAAWVDKNPNAAKALLMAVMEAQLWCEKMENKEETVGDLSPSASGSTCRSPTSPTASRASSTTACPARSSRTAPQHHEVLGATTPPIRSRATTSGSSPRTSAGASSSPATTPRR